MTPFSEKQLTLGEMIKLVEKLERGCVVSFAFCNLCPTRLRSYRGFYDHLALGFGEPDSVPANVLLSTLRSALDHPFEGYKGGIYIMRATAPPFVVSTKRTARPALARFNRKKPDLGQRPESEVPQ